MGIGVATVVPAPVLPASPFGLLATTEVIDHGDDAWLNGITFPAESCADVEVWAPSCNAGTAKATGLTGRTNRIYDPFVIIGRDSCGTFGLTSADYRARARRILNARESAGAERELWTGTLVPGNAHLATATGPGAATVEGGGVLGLRRGLAQLVQALVDRRAGRGLIHARPYLVELWHGLGLIRLDGRRLVTGTGHYVVAGAGYPGTGPAAQAVTATSEWAFATDAITVHRGPVSISPEDSDEARVMAQATDRTTNTVEFRAERAAAFAWNGCANVAVNVNPSTE